MKDIKIYNEEKTLILDEKDLDFNLGYLQDDRRFVVHHEAVPKINGKYHTVEKITPSGGKVFDLVCDEQPTPGKEAYDEYEDIKIYKLYTFEERLNVLRQKRNVECFSIINRGQLWYSRLTSQQVAELNAWYQAWLDVTDTMTIPEKPSWLE